jgi:hypothetical protein
MITVGRVGLEPTTRGLKVRCSATRLMSPDVTECDLLSHLVTPSGSETGYLWPPVSGLPLPYRSHTGTAPRSHTAPTPAPTPPGWMRL